MTIDKTFSIYKTFVDDKDSEIVTYKLKRYNIFLNKKNLTKLKLGVKIINTHENIGYLTHNQLERYTYEELSSKVLL